MTSTPLPSDVSPAELARIASDIARAVGHRILELRETGVDVADTKSSDIDVVTEADREAERLIVEALAAARPDDGVFGEEGASASGTSGITWVIDPIDGTVNYLYDLPGYCVSIAATVPDDTRFADGRRPIAGVVYSPRSDEMFEAWEGGGARLDGAPLGIARGRELSQALVATGFGYTVERKLEQLAMLQQVIPNARDIRRMGSAAYDLCMVASGRIDAYYELGLNPWDYAAGALIALEAGAAVIGRDEEILPGEPLMFVADEPLAMRLRETALRL